jgi:hypothetical protein
LQSIKTPQNTMQKSLRLIHSSIPTFKTESIESSLIKRDESVKTKATGAAETVSSDLSAGEKQTHKRRVRPVLILTPAQMAGGTAWNTIDQPQTSAISTTFTNPSSRNDSMELPIIISEFKQRAVERSELMKRIREMENEVTSITERLSDLTGQSALSDQVQRARDKRKHLREQMAELEHQVRLKDVNMQEIWMKFRWRLEENV